MEGWTVERILLVLSTVVTVTITVINWGFLTGRFVQKVEGRAPREREDDAPERRHIERAELDREMAEAERAWSTRFERLDRDLRVVKGWRSRVNNAIVVLSIKAGIDLSYLPRDEEG